MPEPVFPTEDFLERYLVGKARDGLESSYVRATVMPSGAVRVVFDVPHIANDTKALAKVKAVFDTEFFDNGDVISPATVELDELTPGLRYASLDERMYYIEVSGPASEIRKNMENNDPTGYAQTLDAVTKQPGTKTVEGNKR